MRNVELKEKDAVMWDNDLGQQDYDFFQKHIGGYKRMWQEQGTIYWQRFIATFRRYYVNYGLLKILPYDSTNELHQAVLDQAFMHIEDSFLEGKVSSAVKLIRDIVIIARHQHLLKHIDIPCSTRNPFNFKESREVFRTFFGQPHEKDSRLKIMLCIQLFLRFAGALCTCLKRWLTASELEDGDESYWVKPETTSITTVKKVTIIKSIDSSKMSSEMEKRNDELSSFIAKFDNIDYEAVVIDFNSNDSVFFSGNIYSHESDGDIYKFLESLPDFRKFSVKYYVQTNVEGEPFHQRYIFVVREEKRIVYSVEVQCNSSDRDIRFERHNAFKSTSSLNFRTPRKSFATQTCEDPFHNVLLPFSPDGKHLHKVTNGKEEYFHGLGGKCNRSSKHSSFRVIKAANSQVKITTSASGTKEMFVEREPIVNHSFNSKFENLPVELKQHILQDEKKNRRVDRLRRKHHKKAMEKHARDHDCTAGCMSDTQHIVTEVMKSSPVKFAQCLKRESEVSMVAPEQMCVKSSQSPITDLLDCPNILMGPDDNPDDWQLTDQQKIWLQQRLNPTEPIEDLPKDKEDWNLTPIQQTKIMEILKSRPEILSKLCALHTDEQGKRELLEAVRSQYLINEGIENDVESDRLFQEYQEKSVLRTKIEKEVTDQFELYKKELVHEYGGIFHDEILVKRSSKDGAESSSSILLKEDMNAFMDWSLEENQRKKIREILSKYDYDRTKMSTGDATQCKLIFQESLPERLECIFKSSNTSVSSLCPKSSKKAQKSKPLKITAADLSDAKFSCEIKLKSTPNVQQTGTEKSPSSLKKTLSSPKRTLATNNSNKPGGINQSKQDKETPKPKKHSTEPTKPLNRNNEKAKVCVTTGPVTSKPTNENHKKVEEKPKAAQVTESKDTKDRNTPEITDKSKAENNIETENNEDKENSVEDTQGKRTCAHCWAKEARKREFRKCLKCYEMEFIPASYYCCRACQLADWYLGHKEAHQRLLDID